MAAATKNTTSITEGESSIIAVLFLARRQYCHEETAGMSPLVSANSVQIKRVKLQLLGPITRLQEPSWGSNWASNPCTTHKQPTSILTAVLLLTAVGVLHAAVVPQPRAAFGLL